MGWHAWAQSGIGWWGPALPGDILFYSISIAAYLLCSVGWTLVYSFVGMPKNLIVFVAGGRWTGQGGGPGPASASIMIQVRRRPDARSEAAGRPGTAHPFSGGTGIVLVVDPSIDHRGPGPWLP
jgi:hypothetical protein